MRRAIPALLLATALNAGCVFDDWFARKDGPPPRADQAMQKLNLPQASLQTAARVDQVGHKILATNPDVKVNPLFLTVGSPTQSIYHTGTSQLVITEGLVQRCKTDAELATLLCSEIAAMEFERRRAVRSTVNREPPPYSGIGNEAGSFGPDMTRAAELGFWEKQNPRRASPDSGPPTETTEQAARDYMMKAGFSQEEFTLALPLVQLGQSNAEKEKGKLGN